MLKVKYKEKKVLKAATIKIRDITEELNANKLLIKNSEDSQLISIVNPL